MEEHLKKNDNDLENFEIEMLFKESDIEEIWNHSNPILNVYDLIEANMRKKTGKIDFDSNLLMALAEFHVNNLIYFKENFKFPIPIYCKLMNLLNILLNLREDNFRTETKETLKSDPTRGNYDEEEKNNHAEPEFSVICRNKIRDLKKGFLKLELIAQDKKKTGGVVNNKEDTYYLKNTEVASILDYVNTFYFPFIRLYYHFINIERITENKKIDVIINKPLPVPPLSVAVKQIQEKIQFEEQANDEVKDDNNQEDENPDKHEEQKEHEENKEDKIETYQDLMNRLNLNNETRKIVTEMIEELKKDVEHKITDRQRKLDDKLKDVEDIVKGKKK